ncbi:MAG: cysteine--tRNA ligase [Patescibacteria group bacterium]
MKIFNTLTRKKDEIIKTEGQPLHLFVCGPTVYDYSHIGHARTYIVFDTFVRWLRHANLPVFYLQNITNVDDRIIARAKEENNNPIKLADFFYSAHLKDMKALGIDSVDKYAPATDFIPDIVKQVKTLLEKGFAYEIADDGIYFDVAKFPEYGKLSGRTAAQAEDSISRIDESVKKRNKADFALWKFPKTIIPNTFLNKFRRFIITRDGEPVWRTELGWGRPGWHIEDTAISERYFGPQYDIHGGGIDIKFPHHEAEIAQQETASGKKPFVKIWMHAGHLTINGKKMSKSLGNFITIRDALQKYSPDILRWFFLSAHYRTPLDYSPESADQIKTIYNRTGIFIEKLARAAAMKTVKKNAAELNTAESILKASDEFGKAMNDDFNTPLALASLLGLAGIFQERIWKLAPKDASEIKRFLENSFKTLGIGFKTGKIPQNARKLAEERELYRGRKQFVQSDALREKIRVLGYEVDDTPEGPFIYKE